MLSRVTISSFVLLCLVAYLYYANLDDKQSEPIRRHYIFSYTLSNSSGDAIKDVMFTAELPVKSTVNQKVDKITSNVDYQINADVVGNQQAIVNFDVIPPYATKSISFGVDVVFSTVDTGEKTSIPVSLRKKFLSDSKYVQIKDSQLSDWSNNFTSSAQMEDELRDWFSVNMEKLIYTSSKLGALHALNAKKGDCTEYTYLGMAAYRLKGFPARHLSGYTQLNGGVVNSIDYHDWFDFYHDGRWHPIDLYLNTDTFSASEYLVMRIHTRESDTLPYRFNITHEKIKVLAN